jgi:GNAT superfamily N-acetyltransferase
VPLELRPATDFSTRELAAVFTATYRDYLVPFSVDEATLDYMIDAFDLLPTHSLVAVESGSAVGLANLGARGERTWVGGIGVVPERRGTGIGEELMRGLFARARDLGAREMLLEVIIENEPAVALYKKLRFRVTRQLEVLSLAPDATGGPAEEIPVETALALIAARRDGAEPWQRDDATVANLEQRDPPPAALVSGDAAAVYRAEGGRVSLLQAAGGERALCDLAAALRAKGSLTAANYPTGGAVAAALRLIGAEVALRQYEMVCAL